jgi:hypothetical protein
MGSMPTERSIEVKDSALSLGGGGVEAIARMIAKDTSLTVSPSAAEIHEKNGIF